MTQAYSITGAESANTLRGSVWLKLEDATKELLQPLLVSLYSKSDKIVEVGKMIENLQLFRLFRYLYSFASTPPQFSCPKTVKTTTNGWQIGAVI